MYIAKHFLITEQDEQFLYDRDSFKDYISDILPEFFSDKPLFDEENVSSYYYDEYEMGTCVTAKSIPTLYLEINQPKNIKQWIKKKNRHTYPNLFFTLNSLRNSLFDFLVKCFFGFNTCNIY